MTTFRCVASLHRIAGEVQYTGLTPQLADFCLQAFIFEGLKVSARGEKPARVICANRLSSRAGKGRSTPARLPEAPSAGPAAASISVIL